MRPICKTERETQHHVMRCPSRRMTRFRRKEDATISSWFDQNRTDPNIAEIIMTVLRDDGNTSFLQVARSFTTIEKYHEVANAQDIIGYQNFILGRISKHWKIQQADYRSRFCPDKRISTDAWAKRLIYQIYKRMRAIWRKRCELVHGIKGKNVSKRERKALRKEIKQQFKLGSDGVRANDRDLLSRSKSTVLAYSVKNQKYWIRTLKSSRAFVTEFESNMFSGMRNEMKEWASVPI